MNDNNYKKELKEKFESLWETHSEHTDNYKASKWDERAVEWNDAFISKSDRDKGRNRAIKSFLLRKGVLTPSTTVIDVGAGMGLTALELADSVKSIRALDFSKNMCSFGSALMERNGIRNVTFDVCDFNSVNIDSNGWRGSFDLAFASISPAIRSLKAFEKFIALSRGYCCNVSFIHRSKHTDKQTHDDFLSFYAMINILYLNGYYPEVEYYTDPDSKSMYGIALWKV